MSLSKFFDQNGSSIGGSIERMERLGWGPIVEWVDATLNLYARDKDLKVTCVKEKWGILTIYYNGTDRAAFQWIFDKAVELSAQTCYWCGNCGSLKESDGYYLTLCDRGFAEHYDKRKR